jgi:hypothetical protein
MKIGLRGWSLPISKAVRSDHVELLNSRRLIGRVGIIPLVSLTDTSHTEAHQMPDDVEPLNMGLHR